MPQETDIISISGVALALLMYENIKSPCEQEGFLLGIVDELETKISTDANSHNVSRKKVVTINGVFPMSRTGLFYDSVGRINPKVLIDNLGQQKKLVVGWYIYGQLNSFQLTFRQKMLHRQLSAYFNVPSELFSTCVLLSNNLQADNIYRLTNTCSHNFYRYVHDDFRVFPMKIDTINESCDGYKANQKASKTFMKLYSAVTTRNATSEWQVINDIQTALDSSTKDSMKELAQQEEYLEKLKGEVRMLRLQLEEFRNCKTEEKNRTEAVDNYITIRDNDVQMDMKTNKTVQTFHLLDSPIIENDIHSFKSNMELFPVSENANVTNKHRLQTSNQSFKEET